MIKADAISGNFLSYLLVFQIISYTQLKFAKANFNAKKIGKFKNKFSLKKLQKNSISEKLKFAHENFYLREF